MDLQTLAMWVQDLNLLAPGATVQLQSGTYNGLEIIVKWRSGADTRTYTHCLTLGELSRMCGRAEEAVLAQITNVVASTLK